MLITGNLNTEHEINAEQITESIQHMYAMLFKILLICILERLDAMQNKLFNLRISTFFITSFLHEVYVLKNIVC